MEKKKKNVNALIETCLEPYIFCCCRPFVMELVETKISRNEQHQRHQDQDTQFLQNALDDNKATKTSRSKVAQDKLGVVMFGSTAPSSSSCIV